MNSEVLELLVAGLLAGPLIAGAGLSLRLSDGLTIILAPGWPSPLHFVENLYIAHLLASVSDCCSYSA